MTQLTGLTDREVAERRERGLVNRTSHSSSRSLADILRANILTPFNGLITALAVVILLVNGNPINSLFFIAMLLNIAVGVAQELKAKVMLDRLSIMVKPRIAVRRNGVTVELDTSQIVMDDLVQLTMGDQVPTDGRVLESSGLAINESLLTGESEPVDKSSGDTVMSGSVVVGGNGLVQVTAVGDSSYAARLSHEAKQFKRPSSELIAATNTIMKWIARLLIIVVPILVIGQLRISHGDWADTVTHVVAAIVGMIPEGLVLLTSMAFLLAVMKLARQKVLVQQLPAVETLARVDTLLLDKTGTITDGSMRLDEIQPQAELSTAELSRIVLTMVNRVDSPTNRAIVAGLKQVKPFTFEREIAFNSSRKWSAIEIDRKYYVLGAPEIILPADTPALAASNKLAAGGRRVLALIQVDHWPESQLPPGRSLGLVVLTERIRPDAARTLDFFRGQGVAVKVISGDAPRTVAAVAKQVGLTGKVMDARRLADPDLESAEFARQIATHDIFGRVRPEQKQQIAGALQTAGHVVAMTGDGVNDALALKKADLGIAMNSGAAATRAVAEVVLLDDKFSHLPAVLAEGRRVVANIERVSNLFIIKNVYSIILSLAVTALGLVYPFMPAQMTIISALSIGIPAFFLALAPNQRRYQPGFLRRVMSFAIPTGVVMALAMLISYYVIDSRHMTLMVAGTSVSIVVMLIGLAVLVRLARPIRGWKLLLITACMIVLYPPLAKLFSFQLDWSTIPVILLVAAVAIVAIALIQSGQRAWRRRHS